MSASLDGASIQAGGTTPSALSIQANADAPIRMFEAAGSGETTELSIYGYRAGDSRRSLQIGVGVDAADTASFDGVSNYYFDGKVIANSDSIQINTSKTPASATATGTQGQVAWDSSYVYVCTSTDVWVRAALSTWT
jgi:hypothetical protein